MGEDSGDSGCDVRKIVMIIRRTVLIMVVVIALLFWLLDGCFSWLCSRTCLMLSYVEEVIVEQAKELEEREC